MSYRDKKRAMANLDHQRKVARGEIPTLDQSIRSAFEQFTQEKAARQAAKQAATPPTGLSQPAKPTGEMEKEEKPFQGYNPKKNSKSGGLNDKYREKYNREHGSHLKRPVTGHPKAGTEAAKRKKSFCSRMSQVSGPTSKDGKLTRKGAALRRWNCGSVSKSETKQSVKPLMKPYVSQAQAGFFHTHPEKVGGKKVVEHWDQATKGKHLPERVSKSEGYGKQLVKPTDKHKIAWFKFEGKEPEQITVNNHKIPLEKEHMYDIHSDPMGHIEQLKEETVRKMGDHSAKPSNDSIHTRLREKGYKGFYHSGHSKHPDVVGIYIPTKQHKKEG